MAKKKKEETEISLLFRAYRLQILKFFACEILNGIVYLLVLSDEKSIIKNLLKYHMYITIMFYANHRTCTYAIFWKFEI